MTHTKGEWKAFIVKNEKPTDQASSEVGIVDEKGFNSRTIAKVLFKPNGEDAANARLIAAAPELLDACKLAYDLINELPLNVKLKIVGRGLLLDRLAEALAKAEGKD